MGLLTTMLGIVSFLSWPVHYLGISCGVGGLVAGAFASRRGKKVIVNTGIVLSILGLALTIVDMRIGLLDAILRTYFQD